MGLFKHHVSQQLPGNASETPVIIIDSIYNGMDYLVQLVKQIRPANPHDYKNAELRFKALFYQLQTDKRLLFSLRKALLTQFLNCNFIPALTESGMVSSRGFLQEFFTKIKHRLLPPLLKSNDFLYVINHVFYKSSDYHWVRKLDSDLWKNLFQLLGVHVNLTDTNIVGQLHVSLQILSQRTVTMALEKEIVNSLDRVDFEHYPFLLLERSIQQYLQVYEAADAAVDLQPYIKNINEHIQWCKNIVLHISEQRKTKGTSLEQTYMLFRIEQHLERLILITRNLDHGESLDADEFLKYFTRIIAFEKKKYSLTEFFSANVSFLAFKITEHGGTRGEKYITATRKDYFQMMVSAMGGGLVVAFTALVKNLITKLHLPPFWQGFTYSVNYALGFQIMHETRTTLATKQPAFTASALAGSLDYFKDYHKPDLYALAITIARTSRSQLASFFGNLSVVFPFAYCLAALYKIVTGHFLLNATEAHNMLLSHHPFKSFSIMFACFTGVFLFLSGLIAGFVENEINYGRIGERLKNHPVFKNTLSAGKLQKLTRYVVEHFGSLMGNIALGFFLGMASFIGHIFGVPFDLYHVSIAAANTAIAFYTQGLQEPSLLLTTVFIGVLMIGVFNFLVSFGCAFFVAIKSRNVRLRDYPELLSVVGKFFVRFPFDFFFPPRFPRVASQVKEVLT